MSNDDKNGPKPPPLDAKGKQRRAILKTVFGFGAFSAATGNAFHQLSQAEIENQPLENALHHPHTPPKEKKRLRHTIEKNVGKAVKNAVGGYIIAGLATSEVREPPSSDRRFHNLNIMLPILDDVTAKLFQEIVEDIRAKLVSCNYHRKSNKISNLIYGAPDSPGLIQLYASYRLNQGERDLTRIYGVIEKIVKIDSPSTIRTVIGTVNRVVQERFGPDYTVGIGPY